MSDPVAYAAGLAQGMSDALKMSSSPTPPEWEGNPDYTAGYAQGNEHPSGPVSVPTPTEPNAIHAAGYAHGVEDRDSQASSPVPLELEGSKEYAHGYTEADPAYYAGMQAGRADTIHKRSSATPPEYEGNEAYAVGYADGLAAPPYLSDLEAQEKAEEDARIPKLPKLDVTLPKDYVIHDADHPEPSSMSPAMPGDYPSPPEGEDGEMPHGEYGPEHPGQTWDPKTHGYRWDWEIREDKIRDGEVPEVEIEVE